VPIRDMGTFWLMHNPNGGNGHNWAFANNVFYSRTAAGTGNGTADGKLSELNVGQSGFLCTDEWNTTNNFN